MVCGTTFTIIVFLDKFSKCQYGQRALHPPCWITRKPWGRLPLLHQFLCVGRDCVCSCDERWGEELRSLFSMILCITGFINTLYMIQAYHMLWTYVQCMLLYIYTLLRYRGGLLPFYLFFEGRIYSFFPFFFPMKWWNGMCGLQHETPSRKKVAKLENKAR